VQESEGRRTAMERVLGNRQGGARLLYLVHVSVDLEEDNMHSF
jgi:hypothetical protein